MTGRKEQAVVAVKWTTIPAVYGAALQFLQIAILARLLSPEDFGLMAIVLVITGFAQTFADIGVGNAIIHRQDVTSNQLSSLYWFTFVIGILTCLLVIAVSPLVVLFYHEPRVRQLFLWVAMVFIITPLGQQFYYLLQKSLRFKQLAIIESVAVTGAAFVALGFAWFGFGVWALVYGQLASATIKAVMLVANGFSEWRPRIHFRLNDLRGYIQFGKYHMGAGIIHYFNQRMDQIVIGALLGAQILGYYTLAFNLVIQPVTRINPILTRAMYPILSKMQNEPDRLRYGYMTMRQLLATINAPLLIGLAAISPNLIPTIFGAQWQPAVIPLQILACMALLRSVMNPIGPILMAKGRTDHGFNWSLVQLFTIVPAIFIGVQIGGVVGVAIALLILQIAYYWIGYLFLVRKLLGRCLREYVGSTIPGFITSAFMASGLFVAMSFLDSKDIVSLVVLIIFGIVVYVGFYWIVFRRRFQDTLSLLRAALK